MGKGITGDRARYILAGIAIGIFIGIAVFYLLMLSGLVRPPWTRGFMDPGNITNFTRPFRQGLV